MHSPPPTPNTRSNQHAVRTTDLLAHKEILGTGTTAGKKRTHEQIGLITPRETPAKERLNDKGRLHIQQTAKVLFPRAKRRKFQVYQDPRSPDPFCDDKKNPFRIRSPKSKQMATIEESPSANTSMEHPEEYCEARSESQEIDKSVRLRRNPPRTTSSPRRSDGLTYVFRGKKVFRKYKSAEEVELAASVKPRLLFKKEMSAPKLANPFDEETSLVDSGTDDAEFDGLELSTLASELGSSGRRHPVAAKRKLF